MISSTENTLLSICPTENEFEVVEIIEEDGKSKQELNWIQNNGNGEKEVGEAPVVMYTSDVQELNLIENEFMEVESYFSLEENSYKKKEIL